MPDPDPLAALLVAALEDRERWRLVCEAQRAVGRLNAECARRAAENAALRELVMKVADRLWICSTLLSKVAERKERRRAE